MGKEKETTGCWRHERIKDAGIADKTKIKKKKKERNTGQEAGTSQEQSLPSRMGVLLILLSLFLSPHSAIIATHVPPYLLLLSFNSLFLLLLLQHRYTKRMENRLITIEDGGEKNSNKSNYNDNNNTINKKRQRIACDNCRQRKSKCDGALPCTYCKEKSISCRYAEPTRRGPISKKECNNGNQ